MAERRGGDLAPARQAALHIASAGVLAHESGRECIARAGRVRDLADIVGRAVNALGPRRARRRPLGPSVTTKMLSLRRATPSSSSIRTASDGCRPNSPTSSSGAQRAANATGSPMSLAFVKSTARSPGRLDAMTDSKNASPWPNAVVASTSQPAMAARWRSLTRKPARTPSS